MAGQRSALLLIGMQNEFIDPHMGRCLMTPPEPGKLSFVDNIRNFLPCFRTRGGDVIWIRSEYRAPRDCEDPSSDEVVLLVDEEENRYYLDDVEGPTNASPLGELGGSMKSEDTAATQHGGESPPTSTAKPDHASAAAGEEEECAGPRQLQTDAFLAVESDNPPCAPASIESEFYHSLLPMVQAPPDRVLTKTWFSAFKDTRLLETLRGRFISELYICGTIANVCILATAADAAKHGLQVTILTDCVGYRSKMARDRAMRVMIDDFACEEVRSTLLAKSWEKVRNRSGGKAEPSIVNAPGSLGPNIGASGISKADLVRMVEGLKSGAVQSARGDYTKEQSGKMIDIDTESSDDAEDDYDRVKMKKLGGLSLDSLSLKDDETLQPSSTNDSLEPTPENNRGSPTPTSPKVQSPTKSEGFTEKLPASREPVLRGPKMANRNKRFESRAPVLGQGDVLGDGDSEVVKNILPPDLAGVAFERLKKEVVWRSMYHRGGEVPRLVAVEGEINDDGSFPIYRHPADESPPLLPFSDTVCLIREYVQKVLKHPVNHVLIQHYRDGNDHISEHSDKTLDIARGSKIVNVSLGAQRTMILRTKKDAGKLDEPSNAEASSEKPKAKGSGPQRPTQRVPLPHNSMFVLGLESNKRWLHGIKQDKRAEFLKSPEELSHNGERISLTFRQIATFLSSDEKTIYGQGATSKSQDEPRNVINGEGPEAEKLLEAFGSENHQSDFNWEAYYGAGSDVLHLKEQLPKLFFVRNDPSSLRVQICLHEKGIKFATHELTAPDTQTFSFRILTPHGHAPVLIDTDKEKTTVSESLAIIQYLEMFYPSKDDQWLLPSLVDERAAFAHVLQRMQESEHLAAVLKHPHEDEAVERELAIWEEYLSKAGGHVAGSEISLADIAAYPVIEEFARRTGYKMARWREIEAWLTNMGYRESVRASLQSCLPGSA